MTIEKRQIRVLRGFYYNKQICNPGDIIEVTKSFAKEVMANGRAEAYAEPEPKELPKTEEVLESPTEAIPTVEAVTPKKKRGGK